MSRDNENTRDLEMEINTNSKPQVAPEAALQPSTASDRLYQIAALTAGVFLLATLL